MKRILTGLLPGWLVLSAGLLVSPGAQAQIGTGGTTGTSGTGGSQLTATDLFIGVQGQQTVNLRDFELARYFNKANCECARPTWLFPAFSQAGQSKRSTVTRGRVQLWVGADCSQPTLRAQQCTMIAGGSLNLTDLARNGGVLIETDARTLTTRKAVEGTGGTGGSDDPCASDEQSREQTVYMLVDAEADDTYETAVTTKLPIDFNPPPTPIDVTLGGGNEALVVNWSLLNTSVSEASDILGYQVLCNRAGQYQVFPTGTFTPGYASAAATCPDSTATKGTLQTLDPAFLCSGLLSATSTSRRIKVLQNEITYGVAVVAIDRHGNASVPDVFYGAPIASEDFYNAYRNSDRDYGSPQDEHDPGEAVGGFCALGGQQATGWAALPLLGMTFGAAMLLRRRRRR